MAGRCAWLSLALVALAVPLAAAQQQCYKKTNNFPIQMCDQVTCGVGACHAGHRCTHCARCQLPWAIHARPSPQAAAAILAAAAVCLLPYAVHVQLHAVGALAPPCPAPSAAAAPLD